MDILIHGEGFRLSSSLRDAAEEKIGRVEHYESRALRARVTLRKASAHPSKKQFNARVLVEVPGNDITAEQSASSPLEALDLLVEKVEQQLRKRKTAKLARRTRAARPTELAAVTL
jgi:putative sigma-54 modulation protein